MTSRQNICHKQLLRIGGPFDSPARTPNKRRKVDFRLIDDAQQVISALQVLNPGITHFLIIGSRAIQHHFPNYRKGEHLDWDFIVPALGDFRDLRGILKNKENIMPGVDAVPITIATHGVFKKNSNESAALIAEFENPEEQFISIDLLKQYYIQLNNSELFGIPKALRRVKEIEDWQQSDPPGM